MNRQITNPDFSSPVFEDHPLAVVGVVAIARGISSLCVLGCPSAVRRPMVSAALLAVATCVIASGIYAVERMAIAGGAPHIFNKSLDGVPPSVAYAPAYSAIEAIVVARGIVTPRNHALPDSVLTKLGQAMRSMGGAVAFSSDIPNKVVGTNKTLGAARVAYAFPMQSPPAFNLGDDSERSDEIARLNVSSAEVSVSSSQGGTLLNRVALRLEPTGVSAPVRLDSFYGLDCDITNSGDVV